MDEELGLLYPPTFELPRFLRKAVKAKVLSAQEAYWMEECRRLNPEQEYVDLPPALSEAAERLHLLERRAWPTVM